MTISTTTHETGKTSVSCTACPFCGAEIKVQGSLAMHLRYDCEETNE